MLPTTAHVRRLFFCPQFPNDKLEEFTQYLAESEAMVWAFGMIPKFANFRNIVDRSIAGLAGSKPDGDRILIVEGELDKLMDVPMLRRLANKYRNAVRESVGADGDTYAGHEVIREEAYIEDREAGVRMVIVKGAGHHIQNDLQWEVGAQRVLHFLQQL
jgi:hypothetical protein